MLRLHLLLFLLLLGSFAYFHHPAPGWNAKSRLALTHAIVEQRTFRIDEYVGRSDLETGDAAFYMGHYYSDKIIGTSLLGVPAYAALRLFQTVFDVPVGTEARRYWITLVGVGVPGSLSGVVMFQWLVLLGKIWRLPSQSSGGWQAGAFAVTAATYLGTLLFSYGTLFMPYLPATLFLLLAILLFERERLSSKPGTSLKSLFFSGLCGGLSVLCEYHYAMVTGLLLGYVIYHTRPWWTSWAFAVGGMCGVAPFLLYTWSIFQTVAIPYQYHVNEEFRTGMAQGLMGATWPNPHVAVLLTFHPFRGLFIHSPFLILGIAGIILMLRQRVAMSLGLLCACVVVGYLLFNSAYYMWWGGWSFSPRHLAPAIPMLAPPVLYMWRYRWARVALVGMAAPAVLLHLVVTATDPQVPDGPVAGLASPNLLRYDYHSQFKTQVWPAFSSGRTDPNVGTVVGLQPGIWSLLPLLLFWSVIGVLAFIGLRRGINGEQVPSFPLISPDADGDLKRI